MFFRPYFLSFSFFFFFNDTATTEIYTLSLHDALPILYPAPGRARATTWLRRCRGTRSEEHTSELQSHSDLVCRLLLEKKKKTQRPQQLKTEKKYTKQHKTKLMIS